MLGILVFGMTVFNLTILLLELSMCKRLGKSTFIGIIYYIAYCILVIVSTLGG